MEAKNCDVLASPAKKEILNFVVEILTAVIPYPASLAVATIKGVPSLADSILTSKIFHILEKEQSIGEWAKESYAFSKDNPNYHRNISNLIYSIDAIREEETLDIYANLLHSWKFQRIDRDMFFRLAWCLSQIYSKDLETLKNLYGKSTLQKNHATQSLYNAGLLEGESHFSYASGSATLLCLSKGGLEMLRCGLDIERYSDYPEVDIEICKRVTI